MAKALSKGSEIIAACLAMAVPAVIGYWIDQKIGTQILFTLLGLAIGMIGGLMQLRRIAASGHAQPIHYEAEPNNRDDEP